jgi:copper chaperone CopZ
MEDSMATVTLNVPDISCEHCQRTIIGALSPVDGVRSVTVDIATKQVRVDYDETHIDVERLKAILQEEDYPVASGR